MTHHVQTHHYHYAEMKLKICMRVCAVLMAVADLRFNCTSNRKILSLANKTSSQVPGWAQKSLKGACSGAVA